MFGFGWGEMMVIGIVALIAIGPKELPAVLRTLGQAMGKLRRMASEFQGQFNEALREADLSDLKKQTEEFTSDMTNFDPLADTQKEMEQTFAADPLAAPNATGATPVEPAKPLPQIDVPLPDPPPPLTEKDFAPAPAKKGPKKVASKESAKETPAKAPKKPRKQAKS